MKAYLVDVGILVDTDYENGAYSSVYDKQHGYYDEDQYYCADKEQAIKEVLSYVEQGVEKTYGVVSETFLDVEATDLSEIPVTWQMAGVVCIEADTLEEAIDRANNDDNIGLPSGNYVDSSFEVSYDDPDCIRQLYNHNQPDENDYVFTIVNGIEVNLKDYINDVNLIKQLMQDKSFQDAVSFSFEKEFTLADDTVSGDEILDMTVSKEIANRIERNKSSLSSQIESATIHATASQSTDKTPAKESRESIPFYYLSNCADFDYLKQHLTQDMLFRLEGIIDAYSSGIIDLEIIRDEDDQIDFYKSFDLIVNDNSYTVTGLETLVIKWYESLEDTGYLIECFGGNVNDIIKPPFAEQLLSASSRAAESQTTSQVKAKEPVR